MPKIIFERAIKRDPETDEIVSYWPTRWPLPVLIDELISAGSPFFAASYMNDTSALKGNSLKVDWLKPYLPGELEQARAEAGITRGFRFVGLDPTYGGESTDPDFFALTCVEVIANRGFLIDYYYDRQPVDVQHQMAEDWCDTVQPNLLLVEDIASRGFVYTGMRDHVNNGQGTKYPLEVRKPQSARDKGGKRIRFQAMGARFQSGQVKIPGIVDNGIVTIDPRWNAFVNQWRTFPSTHDDILDSCYWAIYDAFEGVIAASSVVAPGHMATAAELDETPDQFNERGDLFVPDRDRRGKPRRPIGQPRERTSYRLLH